MGRSKNKNSYPWVVKKEKVSHTRVVDEPRYNSGRWRRTSKLFLEKNPLCQVSELMGLVRPAYVTDHVHPVRLGGEFWDPSNYQAMSRELHDKKSGFESQLMGLMKNLEINEMCEAYKYLVSNCETNHLFLIDYQIVMSCFKNWKAGRGYGVESQEAET